MTTPTEMLNEDFEQQFFLANQQITPEQVAEDNATLADLSSFTVQTVLEQAAEANIKAEKIEKRRPISTFSDEKETNNGYNRSTLSDYLKEIGKYPMLNREGERNLSKSVQAGQKVIIELADEKRSPSVAERRIIRQAEYAKEEFIHSNLRLVVNIAKRYPLPTGMELMDLVQEGNLGLMHAIDLFDWQKGFKLSTYATWWIRQTIARALDSKASLIRIPGEKSLSLRAALRKEGEYRSDQSQFSLNKNDAKTNVLTNPTSLDKPVDDEGGATLGDIITSDHITPEEIIMTSLQLEEIEALISNLPEEQEIALRMRFELEETFVSIGHKLGITTVAAKRRVTKGLANVRSNARMMFEFDHVL